MVSKSSRIEADSLGELLDAYRLAAKKHRAASLEGKFKVGNPQADIIADVYRELRRRGRDAQHALLGLLDDGDRGVRGWAAAHCLVIDPDRSASVLEALARTEPWPQNSSAETTLRVWREGRLRFP
jgi:hypothetical protein